MPSIRIGYSTDFNLNNELVGIGVTTATSTLDVAGQIVADNTAASGGVSTFREYQGFQQIQQDISNNILIDNGSNGNFNSLSGEIKISGETTVSSSSTITGGKLETLTVTDKFAVPLGDTNSRDNTPEAGTTRFNQDFGTLEFFDGNNWKTVNSYSRGNAAGRSVWMGGNKTNASGGQDDTSTASDTVIISTLGNAIDFGVLDQSAAQNSSYGTSIEAFSCGYGQGSNQNNYIQNAKFASGGNFEDFGDLTRSVRMSGSVNSSTRGCTAGGAGPSNVIDYNELQTKGDSLDFGDLNTSRRVGNCSFSSPTRGVFAGGSSSNTATIEFITIAAKGNGIEFGNCTFAGGYKASSSNTTRGIQAGGGAAINNLAIEIHTISSGGNAVNFSNLTVARSGANASASQTRVVFGGGGLAPDSSTRTSTIDYVTIASQGDAIDFGELTSLRSFGACSSDSHGGLGGF
jgi:hypothetical protein